jgi:hypothetical protein
MALSRFLIVLAAAVGGFLMVAPVSAEPLSAAELRVGYEITFAGGGGMHGPRSTPLVSSAAAETAIRAQPLAAFGEVAVAVLDSAAAVAAGGLRLTTGPLKLAAGGKGVAAPGTMWAVMTRGGLCHRLSGHVETCLDVELASFVAGGGLSGGRTMTQAQALVGVVVDAF